MSKGNLFLGYARGKVGDVVFSHTGGEQITRARNRSPKNPKAPLQQLQRICFNTGSRAYSYMQDICNHSFEGFQPGTPCQAEFMRVNVNMLREKLAYPIAFPDDTVMRDSDAYNFSRKGDVLPVANNYIVSNGSLRSLQINLHASAMFGLRTPFAYINATSTYADIIEALGVQRGDQLTFLVATVNTSSSNPYLRSLLTGFTYARIILEPADGDLTLPFLSPSGDTRAVNAPNPANEGTILFQAPTSSSGLLAVDSINTISKTSDDALSVLYPMLGTVILSRNVNGRWLRSTQDLKWTRTSDHILDEDTFGLAYLSYQDDPGSSLYLNQAE